MDKKRSFYYIYDRELVNISKYIPNIGNRAAVVQSLIASYNILNKCQICSNEAATDEELLSFHSSDYIKCLKKAETSSDLEKMTDSEEINDFNLGYDCPLFENIYEFSKQIAGSSLVAARKLVSKNFQIKRKLQSCAFVNSQPKSYLKFKNGFKVTKNTESLEILSDVENNELPVSENIGESMRTNSIKRFETEISPVESGIIPVSINWFGGWHHAQRDEAGGFCYVNDIVIAIQYLLKFYKKIVYVDLDIHHGNGVENAFLFSPRVLTFSIHKYEAGFYPSSGSLDDVGEGRGKFYSVNVPLKSGITDDKYLDVFSKIFMKILEKYQPDCIVAQCGADSLAGDPLGDFNLTSVGLGKCVKLILDASLPTLILGGGGYNIPNTARCWAYLTSLILEKSISNEIPDNPFLHLYGPDYELEITVGLRKDENSDEYLQSVTSKIIRNLDNIQV